MQYIVTMRRKQEMLFNFWLAEKKIQKHMKLIFLTGEGGREGTVEVGEITSQNNGE